MGLEYSLRFPDVLLISPPTGGKEKSNTSEFHRRQACCTQSCKYCRCCRFFPDKDNQAITHIAISLRSGSKDTDTVDGFCLLGSTMNNEGTNN